MTNALCYFGRSAKLQESVGLCIKKRTQMIACQVWYTNHPWEICSVYPKCQCVETKVFLSCPNKIQKSMFWFEIVGYYAGNILFGVEFIRSLCVAFWEIIRLFWALFFHLFFHHHTSPNPTVIVQSLQATLLSNRNWQSKKTSFSALHWGRFEQGHNVLFGVFPLLCSNAVGKSAKLPWTLCDCFVLYLHVISNPHSEVQV